MIRRPTDLKSIRAAITAGTKAVNNAIASSSTEVAASQSSPGSAAQGTPGTVASSSAVPSTGATVTLPLSEALVPPKGIVNAAQLEQEVMRMFANAVMFNPGDEGVVKDTREMFDAVQQSLSAWRGAESVDDVAAVVANGLGGGGEDEGPGTASSSKRRRL